MATLPVSPIARLTERSTRTRDDEPSIKAGAPGFADHLRAAEAAREPPILLSHPLNPATIDRWSTGSPSAMLESLRASQAFVATGTTALNDLVVPRRTP